MTHIKQQDIANILKVSRVTVSKALRDHPDISEEMKKKVKQVANQLDYTPNFVARSLSSKRTNTIGVVIPDTTNSYFSHVINGIMDAALEKGYQIILTISRENHELEEKNIKSLMAMRVDGLLVCITQSTKNAKSLNFINKNNIPLVLFDRSLIGEKFNTVLCNDREAAFSAIDFAIKKGYRKIAHLAGQSPINVGGERLEGYKQALISNDIEIRNEWIIQGGHQKEDGYKGFKKLYAKGDLPELVFSSNSFIACGVYEAVKELGLKIPEDIAVIGIGDEEYSNLLSPSLTFMRQYPDEIGQQAARLLVDKIEKPENGKITNITIPMKLVAREST